MGSLRDMEITYHMGYIVIKHTTTDMAVTAVSKPVQRFSLLFPGLFPSAAIEFCFILIPPLSSPDGKICLLP